MRRVLIVAFVALSCVPGVAYADSDGYYCAGPGYLAYQFGMAPKSVAPHRLHRECSDRYPMIDARWPDGPIISAFL